MMTRLLGEEASLLCMNRLARPVDSLMEPIDGALYVLKMDGSSPPEGCCARDPGSRRGVQVGSGAYEVEIPLPGHPSSLAWWLTAAVIVVAAAATAIVAAAAAPAPVPPPPRCRRLRCNRAARCSLQRHMPLRAWGLKQARASIYVLDVSST